MAGCRKRGRGLARSVLGTGSMTTSGQIHVVFGTGQVGPALAQELLDAGHEVRIVSRRPGDGLLERIRGGREDVACSIHAGDATEPKFVDSVCRGATTVYNCASPPYHKWDSLLVPLFEGIRDGAGRAGAKHVVLDNLYMYGRPQQSPFDEDTPIRPCSSKGELRAELRRRLFDAHERGQVRATSGHASDFFGPGAAGSSLFGDRFFDRLRQGQALEVFGDPELPHGYTFIPDVARALAILGTDDRAMGKAWHLPTSWTGSTRGLVEAFASRVGHGGRVTRVPAWVLRLMGVWVPAARGLPEMMYQWTLPYVPDDRRFRQTFGISPTPTETAVAASLRFAGFGDV